MKEAKRTAGKVYKEEIKENKKMKESEREREEKKLKRTGIFPT